MSKLYHYTDGHGLCGILENKALWLTHAAYLNDSQEVVYAKRLFREVIEDMAQSLDPARHLHAKESLDWLNKLRDAKNKSNEFPEETPDGVDLFVASLSTAPDDLGQWRGYSSTGNRYCIEFDASTLEAWVHENELRLGPVEYDRKRSRELIEREYLALIPQVAVRQGSPNPNENGKYSNRWVYISGNAVAVAQTCAWHKHQKFDSEKEWRIAANGSEATFDGSVSHRVGKSFVVPYVSFRLNNESSDLISSIWIGPCAHPDRALQGIQSLVKSTNWGSAVAAESPLGRSAAKNPGVILLHKSSIPYRDW